MRILVTGTTGFIGGNLVPKLVALDHDVYGLERYVTSRYVQGATRKIKTVFADLNDHFAVRNIIRNVKPEAVIHLASLSPVAYSYDRPEEVLATNFLATVNLAEICMRDNSNLRRFIFAGTSEEYGNQKAFPIREDAELTPNSPYAVSKVAADKYLSYMREAYDFPVTIVRPFNTYGRLDNTHFVVERTVSQMLTQKEIRLGDPEPVRDFMFVEDHVNAYLTCLENEAAVGGTFNFCTGKGTSIKELVNVIGDLTGFQGEVYWNTIPQRPLDIQVLVGDNRRAWRMLGWKPRVCLKEGLEWTVKGLKENMKNG